MVPSSNQEEFGEYYSEMKNSKLYNLPGLFIRINPYQDLFVWGDGICFDNHDASGRGIEISYDPVNDDIAIDSTVRYSTCFAKVSDSYIYDVIGKRKDYVFKKKIVLFLFL